jgi:hypothetical protein
LIAARNIFVRAKMNTPQANKYQQITARERRIEHYIKVLHVPFHQREKFHLLAKYFPVFTWNNRRVDLRVIALERCK